MTMPTGVPAGYEPVAEPGTFVGVNGPFFRRVADGRVRLCLPIEKRHTNPMGTAHGGLLVTLMDLTLGMNVSAAAGIDIPLATIQMSVNMVGAAREGEVVHGEAECDRVTSAFGFVTGALRAEGRVILRATGVFRLPRDYPPKKA